MASTFSTSASAALMRSSASCRSSLPLMSLSPVPAAFSCFARSCCVAFSRACSLAMAAVASPPLASFCLDAMSFLASRQAAEASSSTAEVFSPASRMASAVTLSRLSHRKSRAASATTATFFSAAAMPSTTSASSEAILRSEVSFLKLASFLEAASALASSWVSSSVVLLARSWLRRLASPSLVLRKTLAALIVVSDLAAAASDSLMALADSSWGRISRPLRKGISASWHLARLSSPFSTFSAAVASICCVVLASFCLRSTAATAWSFFCEPMARSLICVSSSFKGPLAARIFVSIVRRCVATSFCRGVTSSSAADTSSSDMAPRSAMPVTRLAFSTSSSVAPIFSLISANCFFASTRARKSLRKVLKGLSLPWASVSFCCSTEDSLRAFLRVSGA
mmetsp:Transcript_12480/g.39047  ORF Transcript_12480/g.39047 Transcript_12480/m.39047 type:complete len:396 (-) Transcript_12480:306-1493(-)